MSERLKREWRNFERAERKESQKFFQEKDFRDVMNCNNYTARHRAKRKITKDLRT